MSGDPLVEAFLYNQAWADPNLTYGFANQLSYLNSIDYEEFITFSAPQEAIVRFWLDRYSEVSGLTFTELDGAGGGGA